MVAVSCKLYGKPTNIYQQFVNALLVMNIAVVPRCRYSKQRSWRMLPGKRTIMARMRWFCQMFCLLVRMTVSAWRKASLFHFRNSCLIWNCRLKCWHWNTHFFFQGHKLQYSGIRKSVICLQMGEGEGGTPMWKTLHSETNCELMRWSLSSVEIALHPFSHKSHSATVRSYCIVPMEGAIAHP